MAWLLALFALLLAAQLVCARRMRRVQQRMMQPGESWDPEDLDAWLALIETFPLGNERPTSK